MGVAAAGQGRAHHPAFWAFGIALGQGADGIADARLGRAPHPVCRVDRDAGAGRAYGGVAGGAGAWPLARASGACGAVRPGTAGSGCRTAAVACGDRPFHGWGECVAGVADGLARRGGGEHRRTCPLARRVARLCPSPGPAGAGAGSVHSPGGAGCRHADHAPGCQWVPTGAARLGGACC
ncbi:hypothetical protein D3C81_1266720 [compost metagenome]